MATSIFTLLTTTLKTENTNLNHSYYAAITLRLRDTLEFRKKIFLQ